MEIGVGMSMRIRLHHGARALLGHRRLEDRRALIDTRMARDRGNDGCFSPDLSVSAGHAWVVEGPCHALRCAYDEGLILGRSRHGSLRLRLSDGGMLLQRVA